MIAICPRCNKLHDLNPLNRQGCYKDVGTPRGKGMQPLIDMVEQMDQLRAIEGGLQLLINRILDQPYTEWKEYSESAEFTEAALALVRYWCLEPRVGFCLWHGDLRDPLVDGNNVIHIHPEHGVGRRNHNGDMVVSNEPLLPPNRATTIPSKDFREHSVDVQLRDLTAIWQNMAQEIGNMRDRLSKLEQQGDSSYNNVIVDKMVDLVNTQESVISTIKDRIRRLEIMTDPLNYPTDGKE